MENLINKRVKEIQISGIRKFYTLASKYNNVISLTIGQPDFNTPQHIKDMAISAIKDNKTIYTPNAGLVDLRNAISNYIYKKYNLYYNFEDEIIVTNGASEAIDIALRTILDEGSEVILPAPAYPGYEPVIRLCGASPVFVDVTENDFKITADLIKSKITDRTRCIILPYPSNPTGQVLDENTLSDIASLLADKEIFIISDEIYSELIYDCNHISIASFKNMKEKTIVINGLSKSHSMTGWRIGFTLAPKYLTKHMLKLHQYNATCACSISQNAAIEALTEGYSDSNTMRDEYKLRRDYVYERLLSMNLEVIKPIGAFYIFPSIKKYNLSSFDFAKGLLEKKKVAVVPGDAFSNIGEGYIRISYACSMDSLIEGLNRLESYINEL